MNAFRLCLASSTRPGSRRYWLADSHASIQSPYTSIGSERSGGLVKESVHSVLYYHNQI